jgi:sterol desaturase/sphingolipid hydroxylase (fatty acid hydroxylase superfamily)
MHRVHHSILRRETNSNFEFKLPWWDLMLGTYRDQPAQGHDQMTIGLRQFRDEKIADRLPQMRILPVSGTVGEYPVNRDDELERPKS